MSTVRNRQSVRIRMDALEAENERLREALTYIADLPPHFSGFDGAELLREAKAQARDALARGEIGVEPHLRKPE